MGTPHQFFPTAMKVSLPSLLLLSLTLTLASSASPSPSPCTTALSAAAATTSRDTATLYSLLSPNIQSLFGGTFFTSKSAVLPVFQSLFSAVAAQLDSQLTVTQNDQVFPTLSSYLGFVDQVMDMFSTYGLQVAHSADAGNNYVALKVRAFGSTKGQGDTSFVATTLVVAHISPSTCLIDSLSIANTTPFSS